MIACALCKKPIDGVELTRAAKYVSGWEEPRNGGGLHSLRNRTDSGERAHDYCIRRLTMGLVRQESMDI